MQDNASKVVILKASLGLTFDIVIKTTKGALFYAHYKRQEAAIARANAKTDKVDEHRQSAPILRPLKQRDSTHNGIALGMERLHWQNEAMGIVFHRQGKTKERE